MKNHFVSFRCLLIASICVTYFFDLSATIHAASNAIPNGDFAQGEVGQMPEGWTVVAPNPMLAPTFQLVEKDGKKMLMAQGNGRNDCFGYAKIPVTLEGGKTYRLTVRFKVDGIDDVNRNLVHGIFGNGFGDFNNGIFHYRREGDMIVGEHVFPTRNADLVLEHRVFPFRGDQCAMWLAFRFSPHGKVWWEEVRLEVCEPIAPRLVKIAVAMGRHDFEWWKKFLDIAGEKKCDLALMMEFFAPGINEPDGFAMKAVAEKAKQWKMYVSGSLLLKRDGVVYNSSPLFDREGKLLGIYDKVNLADGELYGGISPGESVPIFKTDFGNVGIMICYDSWHPAVAKLLALKGAEVILCPNLGYYMQLMHARSADNGVVVAATSRDDPCGVWDAGGNLAGGGSDDPSRSAPSQIVSFEENAEKTIQFVTVDLSIESSPAYWGGPMHSAPGGRRVRATGNFYLEDEIQQEVRRWETTQTPP